MIRVGIMRGGESSSHGQSVKSGSFLISLLNETNLKNNYKPVDIFVDEEGFFFMNGIPTTFEKINHQVDVVFNSLHGSSGENGLLQQSLSHWGIPHTSSSMFSHALSFNKDLAKEHYVKLGFKTPMHIFCKAYNEEENGDIEPYAKKTAQNIWKLMAPPWVISSVNTENDMSYVCKTYPELIDFFARGMNKGRDLLVEEYIQGKHFSVAVVGNFRDNKNYVFPVIENTKNNDDILYNCPSNISLEDRKSLEKIALDIHNGFVIDHYSMTHFILHPRRGVYVLRTNTIPETHDESSLSSALSAVGSNYEELIDSILKNVLIKK